MNEVTQIDQMEVGRYLAAIRERAGIKQAELARKITWSPAVLSRIETGGLFKSAFGFVRASLSQIGEPDLNLRQGPLRRELSRAFQCV